MPDLIRHPCVKGDGPRVKPGVTKERGERGVTSEFVMPDLIRHPCAKEDGPRVEPGVTMKLVMPGMTGVKCDWCGTVYALQRPAKPMLREITSFMISLVPP
jgi:hypothetical protein